MTSNLIHDFEYCADPDEHDTEEMLLEDEFIEPVAFRLGIVGVGQCGGNFAAQFYETGYRRILLVNTAKTDLDSIKLPVAKLAISSAQLAYKKNGAGKNRDAARDCAEENETTIRTKFASVFRGKIDKLVVCLALGGGTGSGAGPKVIEIAKDVIKEKGGNPEKDVIVFRILPKPAIDGPHICFNALKAYAEIEKLGVTRIDVDNTRIAKIVKGGFEEHQDRMNHWVVRTFHRFNNYAAVESRYGNFDGNDMNDVLARGRIIFSAFAIRELNDRYNVGETLSNHLSKSLFAASNLKTASAGACVMILNRARMADKSDEDISNAFEVLNGIMRPNSTLHRGIYMEDFPPRANGEMGDTLFSYMMLGGLEHPMGTLAPIFEKAHCYAPEYGSLSAFLNE